MLLKDAEPPPRLELDFYGGLDLSVGITHSDLKMVTATKHLFFVFSGQQYKKIDGAWPRLFNSNF